MTTQHTPTPWEVTIVPTDSGRAIESADGKALIADLAPFYEEDSLYSSEANAAFIVRCVNSHAALVEALEELERCAIMYRDAPDDSRDNEITEACEQARAALKLAKES